MTRRFLVLIDFSSNSKSLLRYAYDWSVKANAELLLVHKVTVVSPVMADHGSRIEIEKSAINEGYENLQDFAGSILPEEAQPKFYVSERNFLSFLPDLLLGPFENLIFVGLKGTGMFKKIFIGSVAEKVVNNISNIVVAVPKNIEVFSSKEIHVAVNKDYPLNKNELDRFLGFTGNNIERINFISLLKPEDDLETTEKYIREIQDDYKPQFKTSHQIFSSKNIFRDLKKVINRETDELLIVQKGSRLLSDQFFRKFLINELVFDGETPLIILP